jgi:hypothetical protein
MNRLASKTLLFQVLVRDPQQVFIGFELWACIALKVKRSIVILLTSKFK